MIEIYKKTLRDTELKKRESFDKGSWVLVTNPDDEEIQVLTEELGLERGHILDALDIHESPRFEAEKHGLYIFLRFPYTEAGMIHTMPALFVITDDMLITIVKDQRLLFEDFLTEKALFYTTQRQKTALFMFLKISLLYRRHLQKINKELRSKRNKLEEINDNDIKRFVQWEEILNDFITSVVPASNIYRTILSGKYITFFKEDEDIIEDLLLSNDETIDICKTNIKTIVNIREAYSTVVANNLNRTVKFLTAITIILTLPTMIASIYGMNIELPFQGHPLAFPMVIGIIFLVAIIALLLFQKKKWL